MTVAKLHDGSVMLHSPVQLNSARLKVVTDIGRIAYIVTPNKLHHLHIGPWAEGFPAARLFAPPGLTRRRPDLKFAGILGDRADAAWAETLNQAVVRGSFFMDEVIFFHRPSATLIVGDFIENHEPSLFSPWQRWIGRLNRMLAPNGSTPINYRLTFVDRQAARASIKRVLAWRPRAVILGHGPCIREDAEGFLRRAFAWIL